MNELLNDISHDCNIEINPVKTGYAEGPDLGSNNFRRLHKKNVAMSLPIFRNSNVLKEFVIWDWSKGQYDWQYPLSVDGHFFSTSELTFFAELLDYKAPNSFEASLQPYQNIFSRRMGVCMNETRLLNVPANIVQDEYENIHGTFTTEEALKYWSQGKRIDVNQYYGFKNQSVHQLIELYIK